MIHSSALSTTIQGFDKSTVITTAAVLMDLAGRKKAGRGTDVGTCAMAQLKFMFNKTPGMSAVSTCPHLVLGCQRISKNVISRELPDACSVMFTCGVGLPHTPEVNDV